MRVVIQRVKSCKLEIEGSVLSQIEEGLLILFGIEETDTGEDIEWMSGKISRLRIFPDENEVMNLSVIDCKGEVMIVSQFTLHASTRKGNRPSYIKAARPEVAIPLYEEFIRQMEKDLGKIVATGSFGAHMNINLINDGPVTIIIDSKSKE
jgi:D-aminoacyl-tRNA deacylase